MVVHFQPVWPRRRAVVFVALLASVVSGSLMLGGCAGTAVDESTFFVDPARYDLYDCAQLNTVRKTQSDRVNELARLMAKAQTGAGGTAISELAYRSDYVSAQANLKLAERVWRNNHCDSQAVPTGQSTIGKRP
jgi:hypothetical protein